MSKIRGQYFVVEKIGPKQSLTPEGFLLCEEVPVARTGMMVYGPDETPLETGLDGIVKIFRDEEEVFRPETMASIVGKPVTKGHPEDDVTPDTWKDLAHGVVMNVRRGEGALDDLLLADLLITTSEGIEAVNSGKREISLGYEADYEEVGPGVGKQSNIIGNHVALVDQARCGPRCAIGDSKSNLEKPMKKVSKNNLSSLLVRAFKAKDQAELEEIEKEVTDQVEIIPDPEPQGSEGDHIHIHTGGGDEEPETRCQFSDQDIDEFIQQNASEHEQFFQRIARLEELVGGLVGHEEIEENEPLDEMVEELPSEDQEMVAKAHDSAFLGNFFNDVLAQAEILSPGIRMPTFDSKEKPKDTLKSLCQFRRRALSKAYRVTDTKEIISDILGGRSPNFNSMSCGAIGVLFSSAVSAKRNQNNSARVPSFDSKSQSNRPTITSLADLNRLNAERYK